MFNYSFMYVIYLFNQGFYHPVHSSSKKLKNVYDFALDHYLLYGRHGYIKNEYKNKIVRRF